MDQKQTRGEIHGCIVCGKPYELYVVFDSTGRFTGAKVMTAGGKLVPHPKRALVACEDHSEQVIKNAVDRVYGDPAAEDD